MEEQNLEEKQISVKRVGIALTILILLSTTIYFGYTIYNYSEPDCSDSTEKNNTKVEEDTIEVIEQIEKESIKCDFEDILKDAHEDNFSVHYVYTKILGPNSNPASPYATCKETLQSIIKEVFVNKKEEADLNSDKIEEIKSNIDIGRIAYLIKDDFIVYTAREIWKVDIIEKEISLLWKTKGGSPADISQLYVIYENEISRLIFSTGTSGLGGTADDQEINEKIVQDLCELNDLGTWMYETTTGAITKIANSERCL